MIILVILKICLYTCSKMNLQCEECNFAAVKKEELKSHVEAVHRNGDYQCDKCDFAAVNRKEL